MGLIKILLKPFLPKILLKIRRNRQNKKALRKWELKGKPLPPPHIVKQLAIKEYQDKYGYAIFVETGTYKGEMVEAQKERFGQVFSVELDIDLFNNAVKRFKRDKNVFVFQGDSGKVLPQILLKIDKPAIFWLYGHYSAGITAKGDKECPILEEIDAILNSKSLNHILLIDDARCFNGVGDYPTIEDLTAFVRSKDNRYQLEVKNDILRYVI